MKIFFGISIVATLLLLSPTRCHALIGIMPISSEKAKEMGVQVRSTPNGTDDVVVELEFKTEGSLKSFSHVSMDIMDGEKMLLGYAAMKEKESTNGTKIVRFLINRAFVEKVTLNIVAGIASSMTSHTLRLKEFVVLNDVR